ncbi:MAG TPA: hypothetical protein PLR02_12220 [Rhodocyclaceae bacterium]|nr:hypothetical protein [Rhodocyclaceae bacterium]
MRTFQALVIVICLTGGVWMLGGPVFFWPDRGNPSQGVLLQGLSSRLLGTALLIIAALGVMASRQAGRGDGRAAPRAWQVRYFILIMCALGLISAAFTTGERGPNPDSRPRALPAHGAGS